MGSLKKGDSATDSHIDLQRIFRKHTWTGFYDSPAARATKLPAKYKFKSCSKGWLAEARQRQSIPNESWSGSVIPPWHTTMFSPTSSHGLWSICLAIRDRFVSVTSACLIRIAPWHLAWKHVLSGLGRNILSARNRACRMTSRCVCVCCKFRSVWIYKYPGVPISGLSLHVRYLAGVVGGSSASGSIASYEATHSRYCLRPRSLRLNARQLQG